MSQGDVLLLPSRFEGLPVAGVQALGAGLAIMGSRIGGLRDLVIDGLNGYLAPDDDAQAFAGGLREMLTDRVRLKEMKQISREMASKFDINAIARRFNQIFSQIGQ
jgi:glycosyltransferase involved in cell wall biosynthesis